MTTLRQAAVAALEALEITSSEYCQGCWLEVIAALKEALARLDRKCEAGPSLQDLWDCWDAVHSGKQEPTAWMDAVGDLTFRTPSVKLRPYWTPLYLHPTPVPKGWQLVPKEPTINMLNALYYSDHGKGYAAMLAAAPKPEEIK